MGMSTHAIGIKPSNEKHKKMLQMYDLCKELNILLPKEVSTYFDRGEADPAGVIMDIEYKQCSTEHYQGIEVNLETLDKDIKIIRFYNYF